MAKLSDIEGIGETYATKLSEAGIDSTDDLLGKGAAKGGRTEIADKTGISEKLVIQWVNRADLSRVKGISTQYADLLECAGVDTVPELAQRNAENLHTSLTQANEQKHLVRKLPALSQVQAWIDQAGDLPRVISH